MTKGRLFFIYLYTFATNGKEIQIHLRFILAQAYRNEYARA